MGQGHNKLLLTYTRYFDTAVEYLGTINETLYANIDTVSSHHIYIHSPHSAYHQAEWLYLHL